MENLNTNKTHKKWVRYYTTLYFIRHLIYIFVIFNKNLLKLEKEYNVLYLFQKQQK